MTLFTLLIVLLVERSGKFARYWQLDSRLAPLLKKVCFFSLSWTLLMMLAFMAVVALCLRGLDGAFYNLPLLLFWIAVVAACIGAGAVREHYRQYLKAAANGNDSSRNAMAEELMLIHGTPQDCDRQDFLRELQNALLWINYRYYLAPVFWLVIGGSHGPVLIAGYAFLRAWQSWLARHQTPWQRQKSGIDNVLHVLDWLPVRLAAVVYALFGHGEKALPAWFASLADWRSGQYQILTGIAQFALARDPHLDDVKTPQAAVTLAKKTALVATIIVALLTLYGALL